jgi:co-chaperonin GroES (HSP10)
MTDQLELREFNMKIRPIRDRVIVQDMEFGERTLSSGIILKGDDAQLHGIRPRWGKVYAVGPEMPWVKEGQYICVEHGRWTRGHKLTDDQGNEITIRGIDPKDILLVSDEPISDDNLRV